MCPFACHANIRQKGRVKNKTLLFNTSYLPRISRRKKMMNTYYGGKASIKLQSVNVFGPTPAEQGRKARILKRNIPSTICKKLNKS
jgi:hypothetical protein